MHLSTGYYTSLLVVWEEGTNGYETTDLAESSLSLPRSISHQDTYTLFYLSEGPNGNNEEHFHGKIRDSATPWHLRCPAIIERTPFCRCAVQARKVHFRKAHANQKPLLLCPSL